MWHYVLPSVYLIQLKNIAFQLDALMLVFYDGVNPPSETSNFQRSALILLLMFFNIPYDEY